MNASIVKSLVLDALYQVLDNSVFRILAILTLLPILLVTIFQFREHELVLLFGVESWRYGGWFEAMGVPVDPGLDMRAAFVEGVLQLLFNLLAGSIGVIFCIAYIETPMATGVMNSGSFWDRSLIHRNGAPRSSTEIMRTR